MEDESRVLARVKSKDVRVIDAVSMMRVSYRRVERLWKRYRGCGASGLKRAHA